MNAITRVYTFEVTTTHPSHRQIGLKFNFEAGSHVRRKALEAFNKRSRKPWLYYGCEATITTPEGRKLKLDLEWP